MNSRKCSFCLSYCWM